MVYSGRARAIGLSIVVGVGVLLLLLGASRYWAYPMVSQRGGIAMELVGFPLFSVEVLHQAATRGWHGRADDKIRARYAHIAGSNEEVNAEKEGLVRRYLSFTIIEILGLLLVVAGFLVQATTTP